MRQSPALTDPASPVWAAVDAAIGDGTEAAFAFLERLVASPSIVGQELPAQQIVAAEFGRLGFEITELPVPAETADAAPGGVAQASYAGRPDVLGRINPGGSPSLLLNGHVDVVPAESGRWAGDPFAPARADGWLTGRGAGDMKGGFAMGLLAVAALRQAAPEALEGRRAGVPVRHRGGMHRQRNAGRVPRGRAGRRGRAARADGPEPAARRDRDPLGRDRDRRSGGPRRGRRPGGQSGALPPGHPARPEPPGRRAQPARRRPGLRSPAPALQRQHRHRRRGRLALQHARPGPAGGPGRVPAVLDARRGLRPGPVRRPRRRRG